MTPDIQSSQAPEQRIADLTETLEKEKVELTPEVEKYVRVHVRAVQDKLQAGQQVFESDLEFIDGVKMWVQMSKEFRGKYRSIEQLVGSDEYNESNKRRISIKQWLDLLHVAEAAEEAREWIDEQFKFEGGGSIRTVGDLDLSECENLLLLPENLTVGRNLNLVGCTALTSLPGHLKVKGDLILTCCNSLKAIPTDLEVGRSIDLNQCAELISLPEELEVRGILSLRYCINLSSLPKKMKVGENLDITCCPGITSLPENLEVGRDLVVSFHLYDQVERDVERLKREGKIKGKIIRYKEINDD
jgi:hypothetical protein